MYIFADAHIGVNKRNKTLYMNSFYYFKNIITSTVTQGIVFNLGDLWDTVTPKPVEYNFIQKLIKQLGTKVCWYGIPGNHDMILEDKTCAWDVMQHSEENVVSIKKATEVILGKHKILVVPYFVGMLDEIRNYTGDAKILFSHFSTYQMNYFAGIVDETDPMFDKFDLIITGDTHANYDNGKWHTCGSTYFCKVDEMVSPNCIPSILFLDENANNIESTFKRLTFPEFKPKIITDEKEATDDTMIYVMISDNLSSKPNIICKRLQELNKSTFGGDDITEDTTIEQVGSITFESLIDISYPDMSKEDKNKLKLFCNRQISIDDLIELNNPAKDTSDTTLQIPNTEEFDVQAEEVNIENLL